MPFTGRCIGTLGPKQTVKAPNSHSETLMMNRNFSSLAIRVVSVLVLAFGAGALAQGPVHFNGSIHDYTSSSVSGGPWELHGAWILDVRPASGKADFSIDMTMSNYGTTNGAIDPDQARQTPRTCITSF